MFHSGLQRVSFRCAARFISVRSAFLFGAQRVRFWVSEGWQRVSFSVSSGFASGGLHSASLKKKLIGRLG